MELDVATLTVAGSFVGLMSGVLLLFAWYQYREMWPVLWWAAADLVLAAGILLIAIGGSGQIPPLFGAGFTLTALAYALMLTSVRASNARPFSFVLLLAGPAAALAVNTLLIVAVPGERLPPVSNLIAIAYLLATAWAIAFQTAMPLRSRWPLAALVAMHALTLAFGFVTIAAQNLDGPQLAPLGTLFGIIHFEAIVFLIGTTIFVVAAMREANEAGLRKAAGTDSLTGLPNRRAFMTAAEATLARCGQDGDPVAIVLFDLDRFKAVNDGFGHAIGDRTLQTFAEVCRKALRPNDLIARIGGEEFAAILPGSGIEAGAAMAERIRKAFALAGETIDGRPVNATLSAGVAANDECANTEAMLQLADAALYRAKTNGRNRVERHRDGASPADNRKLVRVA